VDRKALLTIRKRIPSDVRYTVLKTARAAGFQEQLDDLTATNRAIAWAERKGLIEPQADTLLREWVMDEIAFRRSVRRH